MNILIVEDDQLQRNRLKRIINNFDSTLTIYEAASIYTGLILSCKYEIDIFFIDIHLTDGSGIDFAKKLREDRRYEFSHIVFISSHTIYALEAFKSIHCYDFIYKPYKQSEISNLIGKLKSSPLLEKGDAPSIRFNLNDIYLRIFLDDIFFVESQIKDTIIHTKQGLNHIKRTSLKKVLSMLNAASNEGNFKQCHRSYVINTNLVSKIVLKNGVHEVQFKDYRGLAYIGHLYKKQIDCFIK